MHNVTLQTLPHKNSSSLIIDLRDEIHGLFYGDKGQPGFSFTVIHRKVDKTQLSNKFNPLKDEATDSNDPRAGNIWLTNDFFVKTVKKKFIGKEITSAAGKVEYDTTLFFFEHTIDIIEEDSIIEIATDDRGEPVYPIKYIKRHSIKDVEIIRGDNGRAEYKQIYASRSE